MAPSPQFLNRANNTVLASRERDAGQEFLTFVWPDLPRNQAVFEPIRSSPTRVRC